MNSRRLNTLAVVLAVLGIGLNTAYGREPSRIVEDFGEPRGVIAEVTVNGWDAAAEYRANKNRFEADMAAFARSMHDLYRNVLKNRLELAVHGAVNRTPANRS